MYLNSLNIFFYDNVKRYGLFSRKILMFEDNFRDSSLTIPFFFFLQNYNTSNIINDVIKFPFLLTTDTYVNSKLTQKLFYFHEMVFVLLWITCIGLFYMRELYNHNSMFSKKKFLMKNTILILSFYFTFKWDSANLISSLVNSSSLFSFIIRIQDFFLI